MEEHMPSDTGLTTKSVVDFSALLASSAPFPGGGGASALCGALAAALCSMVANLTIGRKKYAAVEAEITAVRAQADALRGQLLALIDADAVGFEPLAAAYAIPKEDPTRLIVMEPALQKACEAPMEMMRCCAKVIELLETLLEKGSLLLVSDVGVGAHLSHAALASASMNVFVNTASMKDAEAKRALETEADALLSAYLPRAACIGRNVQDRIRKGV